MREGLFFRLTIFAFLFLIISYKPNDKSLIIIFLGFPNQDEKIKVKTTLKVKHFFFLVFFS